MARPLRDGVDYFPFDVGMLRDTKVKLIKGEFGALGILVYINLLCSIYEENGYFREWSDDVCILVSEDVGCGCNFSTVAEIVKGLVRRSLFDERVFNSFGVLTSAGIQRRYIRAASKRDDISIIREYWLLDNKDQKNVPAGILNKLTFKRDKVSDNPDKTPGNPDKTLGNSQSKGKQSKVNTTTADAVFGEAIGYYMDKIRSTPSGITIEQMKEYAETMSADVIKCAIDKSIKAEVPKWSYIDSILSDWQKQNVHTMGDVAREQEEFERSKSKRNRRGGVSPTGKNAEKNYDDDEDFLKQG